MVYKLSLEIREIKKIHRRGKKSVHDARNSRMQIMTLKKQRLEERFQSM